MAGTTPKLLLPYPAATDADNVPADIQSLATAVESNMSGKGLLANLPASGKEGRWYETTDTLQVFRDNGTAWDEVVLKAAADTAYVREVGGDTITASAIGVKPLVLKAFSAGQTANLTEWQNSAGTVLASISPGGNLGVGIQNDDSTSAVLATRSASQKGLVVRGAASQTTNLVEFQNSAGTVLARLNNNGSLLVGSAAVPGFQAFAGADVTNVGAEAFITASAAAVRGLVIRGAASQSANLAEFQNSAGTVVASVTATGTALFTMNGSGRSALEVGAVDSAGAGFRTVRVPN